MLDGNCFLRLALMAIKDYFYSAAKNVRFESRKKDGSASNKGFVKM